MNPINLLRGKKKIKYLLISVPFLIRMRNVNSKVKFSIDMVAEKLPFSHNIVF